MWMPFLDQERGDKLVSGWTAFQSGAKAKSIDAVLKNRGQTKVRFRVTIRRGPSDEISAAVLSTWRDRQSDRSECPHSADAVEKVHVAARQIL